MLWRPPPPAHIHLACLHRRARHCRRTAPFRRANRDIECRSCGVAATQHPPVTPHRPLARVRPAALAVAVTSPVGGIRVLARPVSGSTCRTQHRANARRRRARTRWLSLPHPTRSSCPPSALCCCTRGQCPVHWAVLAEAAHMQATAPAAGTPMQVCGHIGRGCAVRGVCR